jgi:hypothetical protein
MAQQMSGVLRAAFRPNDPDSADYAVLDFAAFHWHEESEPQISHPR